MLRNRKGNKVNGGIVDDTTTSIPSPSTSMSMGMSPSKEKTKKEVELPPSKVKVWILASRPRTLTASVVPVMVSVAIITHHISTTSSSSSSPLTTSTATTSRYLLGFYFAIFACLIQLGTNLYNDYSDFIKGADTDDRVGMARATQKGWLTPRETLFGSSLCVLLAAFLGSYLTYLSSSVWTHNIDYYMVFVTITSVFNAFAYTGGQYPLGYIGLGHVSIGYFGLGDIFAFLYFGLVATITVPYLFLVQEYSIDSTNITPIIWKSELMYKSLFTAIPIGFLVTAIIIVNNLRDRQTDILVGKNTMAVRFGEWFSRFEYTILVVGSYLLLIPLSNLLVTITTDDVDSNVDATKGKIWLFLPLLSTPLAWKELKAVGFGEKDGSDLNKHVGGIAKVQLIYSLLLIVGLNMSRL